MNDSDLILKKLINKLNEIKNTYCNDNILENHIIDNESIIFEEKDCINFNFKDINIDFLSLLYFLIYEGNTLSVNNQMTEINFINEKLKGIYDECKIIYDKFNNNCTSNVIKIDNNNEYEIYITFFKNLNYENNNILYK